MNSLRSCPICGEYETRFKMAQIFSIIDSVGFLEQFNVVQCMCCGMYYADRVPDQNQLDLYYKEYSKYENHDDLNFDNSRYELITDTIKQTFPNRDISILDVGCGRGNQLLSLKESGYNNITGLEVSSNNCDYIKTRYSINTINCSLFDIPQKMRNNKYDCIIADGILEHLGDVRSACKILSGLLSFSGVMFIVVPNSEKFIDNVGFPFEEISGEHINYFNTHSLQKLMSLYSMSLLNKVSFSALQPNILCTFRFDETMINNSLERYFQLSEKAIENFNSIIDEYVINQIPVYVWGAGALCQRCLAATNLVNANIVKILDSNQNIQGHKIQDIPICSPDIILSENVEDIIVITYHAANSIKRQLNQYNYKKRVIFWPDNPKEN
ncbi:MAG: class I SAM-dependent methyltransferase [Ruminococcus sp.]|jgi:2-polyprenyl-3-methyl-5-hydroxy-6-metoxy-1,4-benzoquinol methylase|nr:class I SAM-dependent methyltransferase [Ruminococcus sp.]